MDHLNYWDRLSAIVADESRPMEERKAALAKIDGITGEDNPITDQAVMDFCADRLEMLSEEE